MTMRQSDGLRNFILEGGSYKRAFANGELRYYTGIQPASANMAPTGTKLVVFTDASAARTAEVLPLGIVTLGQTGAGTGTVDTFAVNSLEIMGGAVASLATIDLTAAAVAVKINNNPRNHLFVATSAAGVVTLTGKPGLGAIYNGKAIAVGVTAGTNTVTQSVTSTTFGSGTGGGTAGVYAVNGLRLGDAAAGKLTKDPLQVWSGVGLADNTAGWFRYCGSVADADGLDANEAVMRLDGSIGTSGANLNVTNTAIATGATITQDTFSPGEPAS
jgi:hypothetical protein